LLKDWELKGGTFVVKKSSVCCSQEFEADSRRTSVYEQSRPRTERTPFRSHKTQNTKHKTQNAKRKTQNTKHKTQNTETLKIDVESRQVWNGEQELQLTRLEYEVLLYLARRAGKVVTFQELWREVWNNQVEPGKTERSVVRQAIKRVRCKLGESRDESHWICCVHGVGFRFHQDAAEVSE